MVIIFRDSIYPSKWSLNDEDTFEISRSELRNELKKSFYHTNAASLLFSPLNSSFLPYKDVSSVYCSENAVIAFVTSDNIYLHDAAHQKSVDVAGVTSLAFSHDSKYVCVASTSHVTLIENSDLSSFSIQHEFGEALQCHWNKTNAYVAISFVNKKTAVYKISEFELTLIEHLSTNGEIQEISWGSSDYLAVADEGLEDVGTDAWTSLDGEDRMRLHIMKITNDNLEVNSILGTTSSISCVAWLKQINKDPSNLLLIGTGKSFANEHNYWSLVDVTGEDNVSGYTGNYKVCREVFKSNENSAVTKIVVTDFLIAIGLEFGIVKIVQIPSEWNRRLEVVKIIDVGAAPEAIFWLTTLDVKLIISTSSRRFFLSDSNVIDKSNGNTVIFFNQDLDIIQEFRHNSTISIDSSSDHCACAVTTRLSLGIDDDFTATDLVDKLSAITGFDNFVPEKVCNFFSWSKPSIQSKLWSAIDSLDLAAFVQQNDFLQFENQTTFVFPLIVQYNEDDFRIEYHITIKPKMEHQIHHYLRMDRMSTYFTMDASSDIVGPADLKIRSYAATQSSDDVFEIARITYEFQGDQRGYFTATRNSNVNYRPDEVVEFGPTAHVFTSGSIHKFRAQYTTVQDYLKAAGFWSFIEDIRIVMNDDEVNYMMMTYQQNTDHACVLTWPRADPRFTFRWTREPITTDGDIDDLNIFFTVTEREHEIEENFDTGHLVVTEIMRGTITHVVPLSFVTTQKTVIIEQQNSKFTTVFTPEETQMPIAKIRGVPQNVQIPFSATNMSNVSESCVDATGYVHISPQSTLGSRFNIYSGYNTFKEAPQYWDSSIGRSQNIRELLINFRMNEDEGCCFSTLLYDKNQQHVFTVSMVLRRINSKLYGYSYFNDLLTVNVAILTPGSGHHDGEQNAILVNDGKTFKVIVKTNDGAIIDINVERNAYRTEGPNYKSFESGALFEIPSDSGSSARFTIDYAQALQVKIPSDDDILSNGFEIRGKMNEMYQGWSYVRWYFSSGFDEDLSKCIKVTLEPSRFDYSDDILIPHIEEFDPIPFPSNGLLEPNGSSIYFGPNDEKTIFETTLEQIKENIEEGAHMFWEIVLWPNMMQKAPFIYKNPGVFYYGKTIVEYSTSDLYIAEYSEFNSFYAPASLQKHRYS